MQSRSMDIRIRTLDRTRKLIEVVDNQLVNDPSEEQLMNMRIELAKVVGMINLVMIDVIESIPDDYSDLGD